MARFELIDGEKATNLPKRSTKCSAGYDLKTPVKVTVPAHSRVLVNLGITCKMADNEYLAIVPRSGLAIKKGITVLNTPGTIDADYYPSPIGVILYNTSDEDVELEQDSRVAQAILQKYEVMENEEPTTKERTSGFGSTGI